jgi:protein-disulfide isomerase
MSTLQKHREIADKMNVNGTPFFVTPKSVLPGAPQSEEQFLSAVRG